MKRLFLDFLVAEKMIVLYGAIFWKRRRTAMILSKNELCNNDVENVQNHKVNCNKPPIDMLIAVLINHNDYDSIIIDNGIDNRVLDI